MDARAVGTLEVDGLDGAERFPAQEFVVVGERAQALLLQRIELVRAADVAAEHRDAAVAREREVVVEAQLRRERRDAPAASSMRERCATRFSSMIASRDLPSGLQRGLEKLRSIGAGRRDSRGRDLDHRELVRRVIDQVLVLVALQIGDALAVRAPRRPRFPGRIEVGALELRELPLRARRRAAR